MTPDRLQSDFDSARQKAVEEGRIYEVTSADDFNTCGILYRGRQVTVEMLSSMNERKRNSILRAMSHGSGMNFDWEAISNPDPNDA